MLRHLRGYLASMFHLELFCTSGELANSSFSSSSCGLKAAGAHRCLLVWRRSAALAIVKWVNERFAHAHVARSRLRVCLPSRCRPACRRGQVVTHTHQLDLCAALHMGEASVRPHGAWACHECVTDGAACLRSSAFCRIQWPTIWAALSGADGAEKEVSVASVSFGAPPRGVGRRREDRVRLAAVRGIAFGRLRTSWAPLPARLPISHRGGLLGYSRLTDGLCCIGH